MRKPKRIITSLPEKISAEGKKGIERIERNGEGETKDVVLVKCFSWLELGLAWLCWWESGDSGHRRRRYAVVMGEER